MVFAKIRRVVIFLLLMILCSYFTVAFIADLEAKSQRELEQANFKIDEYLGIVSDFALNISQVGDSYFLADDIVIDEKIYDLEYDDNLTYHLSDEMMDLNRMLMGVGSESYVNENAKYINIAYVFDRFFRDFSVDYNNVTAITYYSNHNYIYSYSNKGPEYLESLDYNKEKSENEELRDQFKYGEDIIWNIQINEDYLDERELVISVPVYDGTTLEGIINIEYSLVLIDNVLDKNYYKTYLVNKDGDIIASNDKRFVENSFLNIKDEDLLGIEKGNAFIREIFYGSKSMKRMGHHIFASDNIQDEFVVVVYIPPYIYITGIISSLIAILIIGKIIFWLNDTYERRRKVRVELRQKYDEVSKYKEALEEVATTDFLTKLFNRRYMIERVEEERLFNRANSNVVFIILMMDIDHFKSVNDMYGHKAGDEVLKSVADTISNNVRKVDLVSRWGGEEMLVVLVDSSMEEGLSIAERIREKVSEVVTTVDEKEINVTLSIGIEKLGMNDNFDNALVRADEALYEAKTGGRNKVVVYNKSL